MTCLSESTLTPKDLLVFEAFAERIAREAGRITLEFFRGDFHVETKADHSPVTIADRSAEEALRTQIEQEFPEHGILGEEFGETRPGAEYRWVLDPIDGTRAFVAGVPQYTVLVALEHERRSLVGAIYNPGLDRMLLASRGNGTRLNGSPVRVSSTPTLSSATVLCSSYSWLFHEHPERTSRLLGMCRYAPGWGDGFGYMLVAEGKADVMLDWGWNVWDAAPVQVCIEEAGGVFTDWEGSPTIHGKSGLAANPTLHREVLRILGGTAS
ncbi:MAG: inositol monophosphatase family protein [Candidatus Omnitrophica bacterium]|nr:inositol monophosphatase family protein [Candidatus Omnitrophota bacterium]